MGSLTKALIGKEDLEIQYNTNATEHFTRIASSGSSLTLHKFPDIWQGTGKIDVAKIIVDEITTDEIFNGTTPTEIRNSAITDGLTGGDIISISLGSSGSPVTSKYPGLYIEKWASNNEGIDHEDQGAAMFKTIKKSGSSFLATLTGATFRDGGSGNQIGVIGWAENKSGVALDANSSLYGGWFYAINYDAGILNSNLHGVEIDIDERGGDAGQITEIGSNANKTASRGLWITIPQLTSNHATMAVGITPNADGSGKFHTGLFIKQNAIVPSAGGVNEAIFIQGGSNLANNYVGIRMDGFIDCALYLDGVTIENDAAIVLGAGHRIHWSTRYLAEGANDIYWYNGAQTQKLNLGTWGAKGVEAFDGYITMKDSGGTDRKIMTCA